MTVPNWLFDSTFLSCAPVVNYIGRQPACVGEPA
jgi:hypothetical protein